MYSNNLVKQILDGKIPVDTNITLNWIDVNDVAKGMINAMQMGKNGERYILANERHTSMQESVRLAAKEFPDLKLKTQKKVPKFVLYIAASAMELMSKITGKEPQLQRHYVQMFYGLKQDYDIEKSRREIDFNPSGSKKALLNAMSYLKNEWNQ